MFWTPLGFIPPLIYPGICMIMRTVTWRHYKHRASVAAAAEGSQTHGTHAGYPFGRCGHGVAKIHPSLLGSPLWFNCLQLCLASGKCFCVYLCYVLLIRGST